MLEMNENELKGRLETMRKKTPWRKDQCIILRTKHYKYEPSKLDRKYNRKIKTLILN